MTLSFENQNCYVKYYYSAEANEFYKGERYSSFGCTNPCKHMKVLTEFKHKTKIVDKKTKTEDPVVKILFPRSIEVTKEVWRKTFLSFGKFNFNLNYTLYITLCNPT